MKNQYNCRYNDKNSPDVLISAFGEINTPLAQGVYELNSDQLTLFSGEAKADYYRKSLGFAYFTPIDKTVFPTPPTGWLTWMYYGRDMTPGEVLLNAKWISENLRDYGVNIILLDDGWQGGRRDWEGLRETFSDGMKRVADEIRKLGLIPGLWLCPHGQENKDFVDKTGGFVQINTFGGPYTVDPTDARGIEYIKNLISRITGTWGYSFLKFDGISGKNGNGVLAGYRKNHKRLADICISAEEAYRQLFETIRETAGPDTFINACSVGVCPEISGLCNGMRTGADTDAEWHGFLRAVAATMDGYFLHNIVTYTDPDCCLLRPPLSVDMARAWATLYGLTGQMLMFDDRMPDLSPTRLGILKKISPAADIRPFDLFPAMRRKSIFNLKINHRARQYEVVGLFNYYETQQQVIQLDFESLGLDGGKLYHAYDFWNDDYLGVYNAGLFLEVPPAACRVITLYEEGDFPVLLSTNRHILQGWPDLEQFSVQRESKSLVGSSRVIQGELYTLTFGLPNDEKTTYGLDSVELDGAPQVKVTESRGTASVSWIPAKNGVIDWKVKFRRIPKPIPITLQSFPYMLGARDIDPWSIEIFWVSFGSPAAFYVKQNGELIGYTFNTRFTVRGLPYGSQHEFEVGIADLDGRKGTRTGDIQVTVGQALPQILALSDLDWESATSGYVTVRRDKSVGGGGLTCGGRRYRKGLGTHPESRVVYNLKGLFTHLTGAVGIEDQNGAPDSVPIEEKGRASFRITGDGRELLAPVQMQYGQKPVPVEVDIQGVRRLELIVEAPESAQQNFAPHANWLDMSARLKQLMTEKM